MKYITYILIVILFSSCQSIVELNDDFYENIEIDNILKPDKEYIVILGDIQSYTSHEEWLPYYFHSMNWVRSQNEYFHSIKCVLQTGDLTNNNFNEQWTAARCGFALLNGSIPYVCVTGNHDYDWEGITISDRNTSKFNTYFKDRNYTDKIKSYYKDGEIENIIVPIHFSNRTINILALEFGPRHEVISWAQKQVKERSDECFILLTHEFIDNSGERYVHERTYSELQFSGPYSTPQEIWSSLIKGNDNIKAVVCGHSAFYHYREDINSFGNKVSQILFNIQDQPNGGDSLIQIWELDGNSVSICIYNTMTKEIVSETTQTFTL